MRKYYTDYEGGILLSGVNIRDLTEREIYSAIGVVEQSTYLFNASLYNNITMFTGTPAKDSDEYRKILEQFSNSSVI